VHDCAVELGQGLACRGSCEQAVERLILVVNQNYANLTVTPKAFRATALVYTLFGVATFLFGFYALWQGRLAGAGVVALVFGAIAIFSAISSIAP